MKIRTNKDLYVGRYFYDKVNGRTVAHFSAIIPTGMTEPFKIPKWTEVVDMNGNEFESMNDFYASLEEGMFQFKFDEFEDDSYGALFDSLIGYANVVNYTDDSFEDCTGLPLTINK